MAEKLTTEEILAACRAEVSGSGGDTAPQADPPAAASEPDAAPRSEGDSADDSAARETPAKPSPPPAATPGSTADILAAARAQATGSTSPDSAPAAPKPAAAPTSTSNILAAARAQTAGGSGAKPAPSEKPVAKAAPESPAAGAAVGQTPSVQEMLKEARARRPTQAESDASSGARPGPAKPPLPNKPLPKSARGPATTSRRGVLTAMLLEPFGLAWTLFSAASAVFTLAMARFMMPNVLVEPPTKFKIGSPDNFPPETVVTKLKALRGIWVVNTAQYNDQQLIYALASVCTHLGCTPNWLEGEQKFKCPCHGSGFYITGINFEGPAPRPLERVGIRLAEDGMLEVDKSLKFQEEMGQWEDGNSFVAV